MTLFLLFFSLALCSLINSGYCFEAKKDVNLSDDVYEGITDRELMMTLIRRIDDLEKRNQEQQDINKVLMATNREQHEENKYLRATHQKQQRELDYLHERNQKQERRLSVVERILKRRFTQTKPKENPDSQGQAYLWDSSTERIVEDNLVQMSSTSGHLSWKQNQEKHIYRRQADELIRVAFYAILSNHLDGLGSNQAIEFENVTTNIGNAYNHHTGVFTAPYQGTYVFSTTLMAHTRIDSHFILVKNGALIARLYTRGIESPYLTSSCTVVLQLRKNDDVEIRNVAVGHGLHGAEFSSFSGFLLYPDDDPGVIVG